jgi:hypothetical protein
VRGTSARALPSAGRRGPGFDHGDWNELEALLGKLRRALEERKAEVAEQLFREVVAESRRLGFVSAYVHYVWPGRRRKG